ncbi:MAG: CHAP domain-containing protein [Clostridia bacterium]|nr:CHAP domain-containing protein [Clostridia bacterium]
MTIDEFLNKYTGKKVDFDGAFGAQCVDLFRQYCQDVLKIPHTGAVEGAKDLWLKYDQLLEPKYFTREQEPKVGDVAIWGATENNKYGHVAIVVGVLDKTFLVFEQDGFAQDGAKFTIRMHTDYFLGFLRVKNE